MKFTDLQEIDRIQSIKDTFALICEVLVNEPAKINEYFPLPELVLKPAKLQNINEDEHSKKDIEKIKAKNIAILEKSEAENKKLSDEHEAKRLFIEKLKNSLSSIKKKESCVCKGVKCIDVSSLVNSNIPPELEPLIDIAKKLAEQRVY